MKKILLISTLLGLASLIGCNKEKSDDPTLKKVKFYNQILLPQKGENTPETKNSGEVPKLTPRQMEMVQASNQLAYKTFCKIYKKENSQASVIFSPYSFDQAVGMLTPGYSRENFNKFMEAINQNGVSLEEYLQYQRQLTESMQKSDEVCRIFPANAMWIKEKYQPIFKKDFATHLLNGFNAEIGFLDFNPPSELSKIINIWVGRKTYGHINDITQPDDFKDENLIFVLSNALYFKAPWSEENYRKKMKPFTDNRGNTKNVNMVVDNSEYTYFENDEVQMVSIPTHNYAFSVILLLPKDKAAELNPQKLEEWAPINHLYNKGSENYKVDLEFPFVHLTPPNIVINKEVINLPADFSNMFSEKINTPNLSIWQRSFVGWDEKGVEAAAATIVAGNCMSPGPGKEVKKAVMHVNHPFFFMIMHHKTKKILFIGSVNRL